MSFIPVPNGYQAILGFSESVSGQTWSNTLWFEAVGATGADMVTLANDLVFWWSEYVNDYIVENVTLEGVTVYDMSSPTAPKVESSSTPPSGSVVAESSPLNVAAIITFYTLTRGRSGRGRNYVAGTGINVQDPTTIDQVTLNGLVSAYGILISGLASIFTWCVCQRYENNAPLVAGVLRPITTVAGRSNKWGTQRRRVTRL